MNRRKLIRLALLVPLLGTAGKCDFEDPDAPKKGVNPNDAPEPAKADDDWVVGGHRISQCKVSVWVEPDACPFYVTIDAHDITAKQDVNVISTDKELGLRVEGGLWTVPVAYDAGDDVRINIHVRSTGKSARGFIAVREGGSHYSRSAQFAGTAAASLEYQTQRR